MTEAQLDILKDKLHTDYVPLLPALLDTNKPLAHLEPKNVARAFSAFALQHVCDLDPASAGAAVVDDFNDNGIDAIHYHETSKKLFIVQAKLKAGEPFKQEDADSFARGVRDLINQRYHRFNQHVVKRQAEIDAGLDDAKEIVLIIAHSSDQISNAAGDVMRTLFEEFRRTEERLRDEWIDFGPVDTLDALLGEKASPPVNESIYLSDWQKINGSRTTYYGAVSIADLAQLFETRGNALLEKNIRYFLGVNSSDVNQAIQETLRSRPNEFFYLSNGVTALALTIEPKGIKDGAKRFALTQFSVINGAQTIASCHHFIRTNPDADVSAAKVMMTLIEVPDDDDFGDEITKARNHQNPVAKHHFAALDRNQERLKRELAFYNIIYRYRPEEKEVVRRAVVMDIKQAAVSLALFDPSPTIPVELKRDSNAFVNPETTQYARIFTRSLSGRKLANAVRIFRAGVRNIEANELSASGQEKLIYRHGQYAILWLMIRANPSWESFDEVLSFSDAEALISKPLDDWREKVRAEATVELEWLEKGPLAFFRNLTDLRPFLVRLRDAGI
jgi:hypothetical protein